MREAPALVLIEKLTEAGCSITAYDPVAMKEAKRRVGDKINYAENMYDALKDADALLLVTEWTEFRFPNWKEIKNLMKNPLIIDGRNIYDENELKKNGIAYYCIGKKTN